VPDEPEKTTSSQDEEAEAWLTAAESVIPARREQVATLVRLIPARPIDDFTVVELGAGDGTLANAVLEAFPQCHFIALESSEFLRTHAQTALASFGERFTVRPFVLAELAWRRTLPNPLRCVLASQCLHTLTDEGKRTLLADLALRVQPEGALLIADVVQPRTRRIAQLYAEQYDASVREQSQARHGDLRDYEVFKAKGWNYFARAMLTAEPGLSPAPLADQLRWLEEAGLTSVDCFWLRAGYAVYGGYKA
jgi:tRNA (cmo5U34)-methyltransferase